MTITFRGKTLTIKQWAVTLDLLPASLAQRFQQGWGIREALTTPALTTRSRRNKKRRKPGLDGLYDVVDPERTKPK